MTMAVRDGKNKVLNVLFVEFWTVEEIEQDSCAVNRGKICYIDRESSSEKNDSC